MVFYLAMVASLFHRVIHERPVTGELIYGLLALYSYVIIPARAWLSRLVERRLPVW